MNELDNQDILHKQSIQYSGFSGLLNTYAKNNSKDEIENLNPPTRMQSDTHKIPWIPKGPIEEFQINTTDRRRTDFSRHSILKK